MPRKRVAPTPTRGRPAKKRRTAAAARDPPIPEPTPSPPQEDPPAEITVQSVHADVEVIKTAVNNLTSNAAETQDALEQLQAQSLAFQEEFMARFDALTASINTARDTQVGSGARPPTHASAGNDPLAFAQTHLPWIDQSLLTSLVSLKLDVKDLIRLLPIEDRPKGRTSAHPRALTIDPATGMLSTKEVDTPAAFDGDFPDLNTAIYALTIYGSLRSLYDVDHTGIGTAIFLYIKLLTRWILVDKFQWAYVRAYFISHFRKYQASTNPLDWINVDIQLFTAHIRTAPAPAAHQSNRDAPSTRKTSTAVCINYNTKGKGCSWHSCTRLHQCSTCNSKDHPAHQCVKVKSDKQ